MPDAFADLGTRACLVGIDSDGCVFPTMEIKQRQCIHPLIIKHWHLEPLADLVRETAAFVNLYSRFRGSNRFVALCRTMELLRARPQTAGFAVPSLQALRCFIESGAPLSNAGLETAVMRSGDAELQSVLRWSRAVNAMIARTVRELAPYPGVRESLAGLQGRAEVFCVSQTPAEALDREWRDAGLRESVSGVFGQEYGSKVEQLRQLLPGCSVPARVLMIGDAPGDHAAAAAVGGSFYPIIPGREVESWQRLHAEAVGLFFAGRFEGAYAEVLLHEFYAVLPEQPPWCGPLR